MRTNLLCLLLTLAFLVPATRASILLSEEFAYPDGAITTHSGGRWNNHSGTAGQADVTAGKLDLTEKESEDINSAIGGAPHDPASGIVLYARFKATFTTLPSGAGTYFAHLKDAASGFRARVFASVTGAAKGSLRLGIAATTAAASYLPTDLAQGSTHTIVVRHDVKAGTSTLWVDPTSASDLDVVTTDATSGIPVLAFGFRQSLSSGAGMGVVAVDDLVVATTFEEALAGHPVDPPPAQPVVTRPPKSQTASAGTDVIFTVEATGTAPLVYQWQKDGTGIKGAAGATLTLSSVVAAHSGAYRVVVTNTLGTATSDEVVLVVTPAGAPPVITRQPAGVTLVSGADAAFTVGASGTAPFTYQWFLADSEVPGATTDTLTLKKASSTQAGIYRVRIRNTSGQTFSDPATLIVTTPPPEVIATDIAFLRTLVDAVKFTPVDTKQLYTIEGIVTSWTSLAVPSDTFFFLQDATAGIAVFVDGLAGTNCPPAGAKVRATGPLGHVSGLLKLDLDAINAKHRIEVLSLGNPLPAPKPLDVQIINDVPAIERLEGSIVSLADVTIDSRDPKFPTAAANLKITTSAGNDFILHVDARVLDVLGQDKPDGPATLIGVLGQSDSSDPRTSGYQIIPTRRADIIAAPKPPTIRFTAELAGLIRPGDKLTNDFSDQSLRPGEKVTLRFEVTDPEGRAFTVSTPAGTSPATGVWSLSNRSADAGGRVTGTFVYTAVADDSGVDFPVTLTAANDAAQARTVVDVYVPTVAEQRLVLTEFYANPTASANAPNANPLHRPKPQGANPTLNDEFVELVNLSGSELDLIGWTISDGSAKRHQFLATTLLAASNAVVVFGGPANTNRPVLPAGVRAEPASETGGLALNNDGDVIVVRNLLGRVVTRVVYAGSSLGTDSALIRFPTADDTFIPHRSANERHATPGIRPDGKAWTEAGSSLGEHPPISLSVVRTSDGIQVRWDTKAGFTYSAHRASRPEGPYAPVAGGITTGRFAETPPAEGTEVFYRISAP